MNDITFGTWSIAASPLTIEYSLVVVEEIRHEVAEGFQKLSRGGIEVGGLLYGVREGHLVRILAIRPAACEHSSGPSFRLSERDRAALLEQMRQDRQDPRLEGLICVGWYVSHTRTEITLTESDQEIFSIYFPETWQVTLVVRPSRGGNMRAGFFVRETDGSVKPSHSPLEFSFPDRLAAVFDPRGPLNARKAPERRPAPRAMDLPAAAAQDVPRSTQISSTATSLFEEEPEPRPEPGATSTNPPRKRSVMKWFGLAAALIVVAALGAGGARYWSTTSANATIGLSLLERDGQLDIEWKPVSKALHGQLEITDGPQTRTISLAPPELALGKFSYKRETGDVQVRMSVEGPEGSKLQEGSRFLGPPPAKADNEELKTLQQRRDELEAEVTRLKQSNDQQAQRIQQLERTLKILQTRPGVN